LRLKRNTPAERASAITIAPKSIQPFTRLRRRNVQPTVTQEKQLKRVDGLAGTGKVTQYGEIPEEDLQQRGILRNVSI
jgi:hypothetical protein